MTLPPRAAAIRGDDYQHTIGWYWTCRMLCDPDIESVSIEDSGGGTFDDVVVRRRPGPDTYIQVKSSNYGIVVVDQHWLLTPAAAKGRSPLQHFHDTYVGLAETTREFSLELWTNRGFDNHNPLLGKILDQKTDRIDTAQMLDAGPKSAIGVERDAWAAHIGVTREGLASFLDHVSWRQTGSEIDWRQRSQPVMELAGLRSDEEAVTIGVNIVRNWVTDGLGPRTAEDIRAEVGGKNLLAIEGTLLLVVNGIDREPARTPPNVCLDFVDLYQGSDSFSRKLLRDPADWNATVGPAFDAAARTLESYRVRRVHIAGALRLPMWFAAGRSLPQVKKWTLSMDQVANRWSTDDSPEEVVPRRLGSVEIGKGTDVAFAVALTSDPTADVESFLRESDAAVGRLIVVGPEGRPSPTAVPTGAWAMGWTRAARDVVREEVKACGAGHVHVFMVCPAGVALMLGHQWNVMPATTVYEYAGGTYGPTITFPGA